MHRNLELQDLLTKEVIRPILLATCAYLALLVALNAYVELTDRPPPPPAAR